MAISNSQHDRYSKVLSCTFGEIEVAGIIGYSGFTRFVFGGKVTTPKLDLSITRTTRKGEQNPNVNNAHGSFVFTTPCEIGEIITGHRYLWFNAANLLPGTLLRHTSYNGGNTSNCLRMWGYSPTTGYDQTLGGLVGEPLDDSSTKEWGVEGKSSKTLTITGIAPDEGETEKEFVTCSSLGSKDYYAFNVTLDAYDGFTQTFSNRNHTISKTIRVKKGAFRVAGTAQFTNLTAIVVDAGATFRHDSTKANPFPKVSSLTVEGRFIVGPNAAADFMATNGYTEIRLSSSATFSVPSGTAFATTKLYVDGFELPVGAWTHADFPVIPEGVTIANSSGPSAATQTLEWSGAAADNLMSTPGNWKGEPASIPLSYYALGVTITNNGTEMVYADGVKLNNLNFTRTPDAVPFTIRPATPGATLYVSGRFNLNYGAQLILKDAIIATPGHVYQGAATSGKDYLMYLVVKSNKEAVEPYIASNNVYYYSSDTNHLPPVVLDNAIIEKTVVVNNNILGNVPLYCMPGTTNEIKGAYNNGSNQCYMRIAEDAQMTFSGGITFSTYMHKHLAGTMVVKDKPMVASTYFLIHAGTLALDAEDFSLQGSASGDGMTIDSGSSSGTTLECRRSFCFNGDCALMVRSGSSYPAIVDLHATTQRVTRLCALNSYASSKMQGDPGSLLEVVGGWGSGRTEPKLDEKNTVYRLLTNRVDLAGALSLKMSAPDETMTFYSKAFTTCGDLEVSAGTLGFRSDASWLNGTNVAVNGEGRLKVAQGGTFGAKFAELSLADEGVFEIPEGASQTFLNVYTNGVVLSSGRYTSLPNGEGDFLAGGGAIVVRRKGILFSIR